MTTIELTFLGTGTSNGVPMIGCDCGVCLSTDPRDRRLRTSAVIRDTAEDRTYLIDTGPELRLQALAMGLKHVDAVLYTHGHADHTAGLDDMRRFNELQGSRIPAYANDVAAEMIRERFAYAFSDWLGFWGGKPDLDLVTVQGPFQPFGRPIVPLPVQHGRLPILGYRIGNLSYITDAKSVDDGTLALLTGTEVLVLNALRGRPHPTHLSVADALAVVDRLDPRPRQTWLTHLSHEVSHAGMSDRLPDDVGLAWDGLTVEVDRG